MKQTHRALRLSPLVVVFFLSMAACGKHGSQDVPVIEAGSRVGDIRAGMTRAEIVQLFGQPDRKTATYEYYEARGLKVMYRPNGIVRGVACGDVQNRNGAMVRAFRGRTKEGIGMGSSRDEVIKVFGEPAEVIKMEVQTNAEVLVYPDKALRVTLGDDRVFALLVEFPGDR